MGVHHEHPRSSLDRVYGCSRFPASWKHAVRDQRYHPWLNYRGGHRSSARDHVHLQSQTQTYLANALMEFLFQGRVIRDPEVWADCKLWRQTRAVCTQASNGYLAKSSSVSPHHRFAIALHSPSTLPETGLQTCPPEKVRQIDAIRSRVVHSLQSALRRKSYEYGHVLRISGQKTGQFLCG